MKIADVASYSTHRAQQKVQDQVNISILKQTMELTKKLMQELQESMKSPKPPANPNGSISIYA